MNKFLTSLVEKQVIVADGAWGTMLQSDGLVAGSCPEMVALDQPEMLLDIARRYVAAGAEMIETNTFGASPLKLANYGREADTEKINQAAASLLKKNLPETVLVSGSCGPTGKLLQPYGTLDPDDAFQGFLRQVTGLAAGGVDLICVETMMDLTEAVLAVQAGRQCDMTVIATMTFTSGPNGYHTMMGQSVEECISVLTKEGVAAVGTNCGFGIKDMVKLVDEISAVSTIPVMIQANAGTPKMRQGEIHFPESPEEYGAYIPTLLERKVRIIGGCCGTTPEYIARIRQEVDRFLMG
ncbi:MAG: homocysteine S-methyltransferase family protein [Fidelibacterota bacterium]